MSENRSTESRNLLDRFTSPRFPESGSTANDEDLVVDDVGGWGWLRGIRERAVALEFRKRTGDRIAIPYSWFERYEFDASACIILHANGLRIRIHGRNLNAEIRPHVRLFEGITRQRVQWVAERQADATGAPGSDLCIIERIEW